jgi:CRP-like cAMP-binding protein
VVGEMSLVESDFASATVRATGEVEALVIPRRPLERLLEERPMLALAVYKSFCRGLSERLRKTSIHLTERR